MTEALALIDQARAMGLTLTVKDGMINAHGKRTPEIMSLLEQMKPMKAAIVDALQPDLDFAIDDVDAMPMDPVPPMRIYSERPALPRDQWLTGLTPADALAAHGRLSATYFCSCGADACGWFVRCDPRHYEVWL
jgi:hypothetical protein